ncbi:MAG: hypothetical protein Q4B60_00255 [Erysipelotrichaceae bacterium]|nr:hypothetical protein [Erysipelotrichaceae bacterium]
MIDEKIELELTEEEEQVEEDRYFNFFNFRIYSDESVVYSHLTLRQEDLLDSCKYLEFYKNKMFYMDLEYQGVKSSKEFINNKLEEYLINLIKEVTN